MGFQLLCAAEVANFERRLLLMVEDSFGVDEDVVGLDVTVRNAPAMQHGEALEELVSELLND